MTLIPCHVTVEKWYQVNAAKNFNFNKEIHEYCVSDVKILMEGCMKFRKLVMSITGEKTLELNEEEMIFEEVLHYSVDPLSFLTIASVCLGTFRSKFLPEKWKILTLEEHLKNSECFYKWECSCKWLDARKRNATSPLEFLNNGIWTPASCIRIKKTKFVSSPIAVNPPHGYNKADNHSKQSLQWLAVLERSYQEKGFPIEIQHARSENGEKVVYFPTHNGVIHYKLDGYFEIGQDKYVCEFYGCN